MADLPDERDHTGNSHRSAAGADFWCHFNLQCHQSEKLITNISYEVPPSPSVIDILFISYFCQGPHLDCVKFTCQPLDGVRALQIALTVPSFLPHAVS